MNLRFSILLAWAAFAFSAGAQATDKTLQPTAPFIAKMPAISSWKIVSTAMMKPAAAGDGQDPVKAPPASSREMLVSKSGSRRLETTVSSKGAKSEKFYVKGLLFQAKSGYAAGDVFVEPAPGGSELDFPELAWVGLETFVEVRKENGKSYFVYVQNIQAMKINRLDGTMVVDSSGDSKTQVEAWIEVESNLPYRVRDGIWERTYDFKAAPGKVEPSADIRKRVESYFNGVVPP